MAGASCLVLGAGGFIGGHLCRALTGCGARVSGFSRTKSYPEDLDGIRWQTGDLADRAALARVVDGADYVFHLLGSTTPASSNKDPVADLIAGPLSSLHLLEICVTARVGKLVFVSSGGSVYGATASVPIPESAPTNPISAYGIGKLTTEKYLALYEHLHNSKYAVLRVANPFGPRQAPDRRQGLVAAFIQAALNRQSAEVWGDGTVVRDYLFVTDVVDAILGAAVYDGAHRVFNVGSGVGRSVLSVLDDIATLTGKSQSIPPIFKAARPADVPVNVLDTSLISREMGWSPKIEWFAGLEVTAAWLNSLASAEAGDPRHSAQIFRGQDA